MQQSHEAPLTALFHCALDQDPEVDGVGVARRGEISERPVVIAVRPSKHAQPHVLISADILTRRKLVDFTLHYHSERQLMSEGALINALKTVQLAQP